MRVRSAGNTDVGRKRKQNEDAFLRDDSLGLYVVADGMGGHAKGEVASGESVETIHGFVAAGVAKLRAYAANSADEEVTWEARRLVEGAIQNACYMVYGMAEVAPEHRGMGTTISVLQISGMTAFLGQVGDSRIYRIRADVAEQLTEDHTLVREHVKAGLITEEQAKVAPYQNVITRAVGNRDWVQVDTMLVPMQSGDRFLLCSDGLHGYLETGEIPGILEGINNAEGCDSLIQLANSRGGKDNITALLIEVAA